MKQKIIRADGIEYERKIKQKKFDKVLYIRISEDELDKIKIIAKKNNIKYSELVRKIIKEYLEDK